MTFGSSWQCNRAAIDQIKASRRVTTGEMDEAVYLVDPEVGRFLLASCEREPVLVLDLCSLEKWTR